MQTRVRDLVSQGDILFTRRRPVLGLWQEIARNFVPWRADFLSTAALGDGCLGEAYASDLMTSHPVLAHRELKDQIAAMLRPTGKGWFTLTTEREVAAKDSQARAWFEHRAEAMRRMMYDRAAGFTMATKEADSDYAAFGQCVLSVEFSPETNALLFRNWHMRDCAWAEDAHRRIDTMHRKWRLPVRSLLKLFPKTVDARAREKAEKDPNFLVDLRHIVLPADEYDFTERGRARNAGRFPFVSIYIDETHDGVLAETPRRRLGYLVPRWQTMTGTAYALSPATMIALPDARQVQAMALTLLEAGEKAVNPPLIAVGNQIQGGVNVYPGGVTWVDADYDERTGEAVRALNGFGKGQLAFGVDMLDRLGAMIEKAFYLDKIRLPPVEQAMTATEIRARTSDWIRAALPLFEPMEAEYNGAICEEVFAIALERGAFGDFRDMPEALRGQDVKFEFQSPISQAQERDKAQGMLEALQLVGAASQIDTHAAVEIDARKMLRDALLGTGPADWLVPDKTAIRVREQAAEAQKLQGQMAEVAQGAEAAAGVGNAAQQLQAAGLVPQASPLPQIEGAPA